MAKQRTYHEQTTIDYTLRLREILKTLPPFTHDFFPGYRADIIYTDEDELCV